MQVRLIKRHVPSPLPFVIPEGFYRESGCCLCFCLPL